MNNQKGKSIVRYTCNHCFKTWRQKDSFHKHLKICKGKGSAAATAPKYHCNKCTITFACRRSFRKHKCKKISQQIGVLSTNGGQQIGGCTVFMIPVYFENMELLPAIL